MEVITPYYEDYSRVSNSAIGWFVKKGPQYFKDMLDGKEEGLSGSFLERGTMIHMYILEPEEFWHNYIILDFDTPKVKQQKDFCEHYANSLEFLEDTKLLAAYNFSYSNSKTIEQKLSIATELKKTYAKYIEYLELQNLGKKIISFSDLTMLKKIKENINNHVAANLLLTDDANCENCNEFHINWEKNDIPCKSLVDRIKIDIANKKLTIIDLKTTSDIYNFKHSVEEYDYYRQIQFYINAAKYYLINEKGITLEDIEKWTIEAYIVAVQTNGNNEVKVFNMLNKEELLKRENLINKTLSEISYHIQTGNWEHTRNYYENEGIEEL